MSRDCELQHVSVQLCCNGKKEKNSKTCSHRTCIVAHISVSTTLETISSLIQNNTLICFSTGAWFWYELILAFRGGIGPKCWGSWFESVGGVRKSSWLTRCWGAQLCNGRLQEGQVRESDTKSSKPGPTCFVHPSFHQTCQPVGEKHLYLCVP